MFKKILRVICYLAIIIYVLTAPFYLNNTFTKKYLTESTESEWSGIINMWDIPRLTVNGSEFGWIKSRIDAYHKINPKVHIELRELHYDDNKEIAFNAAIGDDYPDIMPLIIGNEVLPLDNVSPVNFLDEDDSLISIKDELIGTVYKDEKIWGIPVYYSINVLIINKDLLASLGIKVPSDLTFSEFLSLLKNINEKDTKGDIIPYDFYIGEESYSYMPYLLSDGTIFSNETADGVDFYTPEALSGLQKLNTIGEQIKNLPQDYGLRSKAQVLDDFLNEKTAILSGNLNDVNSLLRKANQGKGFEFIVMPYPKGKTDIPVYFAESVASYAIMESQNDEKEQAIYDFMKFLLSEDSQNSVESLGKLPSVEGYPYKFEKHSYLNSLNDSTFLHVMPFYLDRKLIHDTIDEQLRKMFQKDQPSTETLYNIQQTTKDIINREK